MADTCIVKSVTLQANEEFVLPPGAELIAVSNIDNITTTCNVDNLEELQCYVTVIGVVNEDDHRHYLEEGVSPTHIDGFYLNGVFTEFSTPFYSDADTGFYDLSALFSELQSKLPGIIAGNFYYGSGPVPGFSPNSENLLQIRTVPSIADNLFLHINTKPGETTLSNMDIRIPFKTLQEAGDSGVNIDLLTELCSEI